MNRGDMAFKLGVSFVSIAEIIGMLYVGVFGSIQEYDPVHEETIGLVLIIIATIAACAMFLVILFYAIKWKGTAANSTKNTENTTFEIKTER